MGGIDLTPKTLPAVLRRMRQRIDLLERRLSRGGGSSGGTSVKTTTDWNTATAAGFWSGNSAANAPVTGQVVGIVETDGDLIVQYATGTDATRQYVRRSSDGGATWTTWSTQMSRHIQDNATNGRAYVGTGTTATNDGSTYIGMSPVGGADEDNANAFWFQTSERQVFSIGKDGAFTSPMMPSRMASGRATTSSGGSVTVTFPTGRFTTAPNVTHGSASLGVFFFATSASTTSVSFASRTRLGDIISGTVHWQATQE